MSFPTPGSTRDRNRLQLVDALRRRGRASRADLAADSGLSRATVSGLITDMQGAGLVEEVADAKSGAAGGRPASLLSLRGGAGAVLGVDFGHSHLRVVLGDLSSHVLAERSARVDVDRAAEVALDHAALLVDEVLAEAGVQRDTVVGVGMGLPGPIDAATGVVGSTVILGGWSGLTPAQELSRRLDMPVEVDNDANLGALGELAHGAAAGARNVVYLKIASGIGAGLVVDGQVFRGSTGVAGELGHVVVEPGGGLCRCGNRGCLETVVAAGPLIELVRPTQEIDSLGDIVAAAAAGDIACVRVISDAGRSVGRALATVANVLNPERVVVGGELSGAGEPLLAGIRESLGRYALPAASEALDVRLGQLGDRAEVLGALRLVIGDTERIASARLLGTATTSMSHPSPPDTHQEEQVR